MPLVKRHPYRSVTQLVRVPSCFTSSHRLMVRTHGLYPCNLGSSPSEKTQIKKIKMNNKDVGIKTEFHILNFFVQLGYTISIPYGDNARYDFIIDIKGKLYKIQCKHGRVVDECKLMWDSCSHNPNNYNKKDYVGDADYFAVYNEKVGIYLYKIDNNTPKTQCTIYLTKYTKNNQVQNIKFAADYEANYVLQNL